ncbi:MAG: hypothetical protein Q8M94_08155 [Ignavibacteria bacterium]|nr:hypothetical protein [Ignavibacteria bacterium]
MKEEKIAELKAQIYDIIVEKDRLMTQYRELNEKQALLQKQLGEKPAN